MKLFGHRSFERQFFTNNLSSVRGNVLEVGPGLRPLSTYLDKGVFYSCLKGPSSPCDSEAQDFRFQDEYFDAIIFRFVLCSALSPEYILSECTRVLRRGGTITFLEHGLNRNPIVSPLQRAGAAVRTAVFGSCRMANDPIALVSKIPRLNAVKITEYDAIIPWIVFRLCKD